VNASSVSTTWQVGFAVPFGAPLAYLLLAAFVLLALYGSQPELSAGARRVGVVLLRWLSALAAWALAVQPIFWVERLEQEPGQVALVVDTSRSMGVRVSDETRLDAAQKLVERLRRGSTSTTVRLYGLASELTPLSGDVALRAEGPESALSAKIVELAKDREVGAILLVSDGADTEPVALPEDFSARVHTVLTDDARPLRDDAIAEIKADGVAFLRGVGKVTASVTSRGLGERDLILALRRDGRVLAVKPVHVSPGVPADVELDFTPASLGREAYTLELSAEGADARDDVPENNQRAFLVRVTRDRLRVLHVSGRPSWDQRFLRGFLKRDPSLDLVSFFILRSVHDLTMSSPSELALIPFPTDELFRQHLTSFDVVLMQDFDYAPYQMAPYLPLLRDYVRGGGGLAMVGGTLSFDGGGYGETALAEVLPVRMRPTDPRGASVVEGEFSPLVPPALVHHPLLELAASGSQTVSAFKKLAPLVGANSLLGAEPSATVLLEHDSARTPSGERLPVLAVGDYGKGRSLAFATDTSWHWGMPTAGTGGDPSAYDRFWDRAVRWLSRDPLLEPAQITTAQPSYTPGARVAVTGVARDRRYRELGHAPLTLRVVGSDRRVALELAVESDDQGAVTGAFAAPSAPGVYTLELVSGDVRLAQEPFLVELSGVELSRPEPQPDRLEQLARATGGNFYERPDQVPGPDELDRSRTTSLGMERHAPFGEPLWALAVFALIALEWVVRRRLGLR
jgi:uncharacterized membrane protein